MSYIYGNAVKAVQNSVIIFKSEFIRRDFNVLYTKMLVQNLRKLLFIGGTHYPTRMSRDHVDIGIIHIDDVTVF